MSKLCDNIVTHSGTECKICLLTDFFFFNDNQKYFCRILIWQISSTLKLLYLLLLIDIFHYQQFCSGREYKLIRHRGVYRNMEKAAQQWWRWWSLKVNSPGSNFGSATYKFYMTFSKLLNFPNPQLHLPVKQG